MSPPSFQEAKNKRQKARAAGLDLYRCYAVERLAHVRAPLK